MTAAYPRSSRGARVYSQSGDIDQLLEDVWVPDDRAAAPAAPTSGGQRLANHQPQRRSQEPKPKPATEKERLLMAQLEYAQRQLRELGRLRWDDGGNGSGSSDTQMSPLGWGDGGSRSAGRHEPRLHRDDYYHEPVDSWNGDGGDGSSVSDSDSDETRDSDSPEPLYVNTEIVAAAAAAVDRVPTPPPRTRLPSQQLQSAGSSALQPAGSSALQPAGSSAAAAAMRGSSSANQSQSYRHSEKESASKHEESQEVQESVSIFQVFPPTDQQPPKSGQPQPRSPHGQPQQPPTRHDFPPREGRHLNELPSTDSPGGGVFRFPTLKGQPPPRYSQQKQQSASAHQHQHQESSSSYSKQAEQHHSHGQHEQHQHQLMPRQQPPPSHGLNVAIGHDPEAKGESNRSQLQQQEHGHSHGHSHDHSHSHSHSHQSETAQASSSSCQHSSHQVKEAASSSRQESRVSDVYSETTSLRPIGTGIKTLPIHTAQHHLRQASSGYQLGNNRLRTLNLSTPQLDRTGPFHTLKQPQQPAPTPSPPTAVVGPLRGSNPQVPVAAATTSAPVQVLPMAFMVAMPTASLSLQQLNGFGTAATYLQVPQTAAPSVQQPPMLQGQESLRQGHSLHQSRHQHTQHHQHQQQQQQRQQRQFQSSRSLSRNERIPNQAGSIRGGSFRISTSSATAAGASSALLQPPRVVVDTASSSSCSTVHADCEGESKTYMEVTELRPILITGGGNFQQSRGRSLDRGACSMSSSEPDDAVFSNAAYATATLQASTIEPRSSFLRVSSSSQQRQPFQQQQHQPFQQQQQQQQFQQRLQTGGYTEVVSSNRQSNSMQFQSSGGGSGGGGGGWLASPGSNSPSHRYSGHSAGGSSSFDFDPPSPGGMLKFVNDTSQFWYLPNISRDEAIAILKPLSPGRFVVRDSTSFAGAYGLAVKVAEVPPGAPPADSSASAADELVRHFLIEQTSRGVRIRGCANEPVFASLAALIYQHTVMPLALPCRLALPPTNAPNEALDTADNSLDPRVILEHGAACSVLYLGAVDIESLTGSGGLSRGVDALLRHKDHLRTCVCQLKVARDGISLTDNSRRQFFRKHYPTACVLHCGMVPSGRSFDSEETRARGLAQPKMFGFVARKNTTSQENTAVILCEIEEHQPAEAVVRFVCKYLIGR